MERYVGSNIIRMAYVIGSTYLLLLSTASPPAFASFVADRIDNVSEGVSRACGSAEGGAWFCNTDVNITQLNVSQGDLIKFEVPHNMDVQEAYGPFIITQEDCKLVSQQDHLDTYECLVSKTGTPSKKELIIGLNANGDESLLSKDIKIFDMHEAPPEPFDPEIHVTNFDVKDRMGNYVKDNPSNFVPTLSTLSAVLSFTMKLDGEGKTSDIFYAFKEAGKEHVWQKIPSDAVHCDEVDERKLACTAIFHLSSNQNGQPGFQPEIDYELLFSYYSDGYNLIDYNDSPIFQHVKGAYTKPISGKIIPEYAERNIDPSKCFFLAPNQLSQSCNILIGSKSAKYNVSYFQDPDIPAVPTLDGKPTFSDPINDKYSIDLNNKDLSDWGSDISSDNEATFSLSQKAIIFIKEKHDVHEVIDIDNTNDISNYYNGVVEPSKGDNIGVKVRLNGDSGEVNASSWRVSVEGLPELNNSFTIDSDGVIKYIGYPEITPQVLNLKVTGVLLNDEYSGIFPVSVQSTEQLIWGMNKNVMYPMTVYHERAILTKPPKDGYRQFASLDDVDSVQWRIRPLENSVSGQLKVLLLNDQGKCLTINDDSGLIVPKICDESTQQEFYVSLDKASPIYVSASHDKVLDYEFAEGEGSHRVLVKNFDARSEYQDFIITRKYPGSAFYFDVNHHKVPVQAKSYHQSAHKYFDVDDDSRQLEYSCTIEGLSSCNIEKDTGVFYLPNKSAGYKTNVVATLNESENYFKTAVGYDVKVTPSKVSFVVKSVGNLPKYESEQPSLVFSDLDRTHGSDVRGNMYYYISDASSRLTNDFSIYADDVFKLKFHQIASLSSKSVQSDKRVDFVMHYCHMWDYDPGRDDWLCNGVAKLNLEEDEPVRNHKNLNDFESSVVESFIGWSENIYTNGMLLFEVTN